MRILVTGGAGFIGSHITDAYLRAGHHVSVIDNLVTGFRENVHPKARFYKADIRNLALVGRIMKKERPEAVNHHAAIAEVVKSLRNPLPTLQTNVLGTANVLLALGKYGRGKKKKFIFSSTGGAIYGEPKKIPADEATAPTPLSPYGLSKLLGEELIKFYSRFFGFSYLIFRYPNVYGPRQNPKGEAGVIAIFGGLMKRGRRPTIFGDGTKCRDYTYVADIVRANLTGLRKGESEILNLGWGKPVSDQKIFSTLRAQLGFDEDPIYLPYRKGEVYRIALRAAKAKRLLNWKPRVRLKEGIRKTLKSLP
jgi:UDP-glucose 4-epimerase